MLINVIDAPMGAGKTNGAINMIKTGDKKNRYIYVTPYKSEIDRIMAELKQCHFTTPKDSTFGVKKRSFDYLVSQNHNIVTSHALFDNFLDEVSFKLIAEHNYTLIMDEVSCPLEALKIYRRDIPTLQQYTTVDDRGIVHWTDNDYEDIGGKFSDERKMIDASNVVCFNDTQYVAIMPAQHFTVFKEIFVLTYMFDCQLLRYYFDLFDCEYKYFYVHRNFNGSYSINNEHTNYDDLMDARMLVDVYEGKYNEIGDKKFDLSMSWYQRNGNLLKKVGSNCRNYFLKCGADSRNVLWTTFSEYELEAAPHGFKNGYDSHNMRATNKHRHRNVVAYPVNVFSNVTIKTYFAMHGIKIDEDRYALSEMIQFIWRAAIRDGKPIQVYVPSSRMRGLLTDYLEGKIA